MRNKKILGKNFHRIFCKIRKWWYSPKIHSFSFKISVSITAYVSSPTPRKGGVGFSQKAGSLGGNTETSLIGSYAVSFGKWFPDVSKNQMASVFRNRQSKKSVPVRPFWNITGVCRNVEKGKADYGRKLLSSERVCVRVCVCVHVCVRVWRQMWVSLVSVTICCSIVLYFQKTEQLTSNKSNSQANSVY